MIAWLRKHLLRTRKPCGARHTRRGALAYSRRGRVETLEMRRLLTVTASVTGGALSVQITGTDTAVITEGLSQDVEIKDSTGTIVFSGPLANAITNIRVTSSGSNDTTDLTDVGQSGNFSSLATIDVGPGSGAQVLLSGSYSTTGEQSYNAATVLRGDTTVTSTAGGNITFAQTLDSAPAIAYALVTNTSGTTMFGGLVGSLNPLKGLTTDAVGATAINGGGVTTTGGQFYENPVTLAAANTTLRSTDGATIYLGESVDGSSTLTINTAGTTILGGPVGDSTPLTSLAINNGQSALGGPVSTTGGQTYQGAVTLQDNTTLITHGAGVTFGGTIDAIYPEGQTVSTIALTIDTTNGGAAPAGGPVSFGGDIGDTIPIGTLIVTAGGPLTIAHRITTAANQLFTVMPSTSAADGLTLAAGGLLSSGGAVELRSGGNLAIADGGGINASSIALRGGFNNDHPAAASVMLLAGNLQAPTVNVFTGNGNTTANVLRTLANTTTIITGGGGVNTYNLSSGAPGSSGVLATLAGGIIITGGSGTNTLVLGEAADVPGLPGTLTANLITGFGMAGIQYANLQNIVFRLSTGPAETLTVAGTSPGSAVAINGGQTIVLGGSAGGLDQLAGPLAINGAAAVDINDQLSTTPHTYNISGGSFSRTDAGAAAAAPDSAAAPGRVGIALAGVRNIAINGGTGKNIYNVFLPLAPGQSVAIRGGGGGNYVHVIGSTAEPNTAYVGNLGSGDAIQIGGVNCLTMYGAANQSNIFVNQTSVGSILIGGLGNDTLVGGSGPDVIFGGGGNDFLVAGGTAGSPGTDYIFANMLPVYMANGMLNPDVGNGAVYPGLPGTSMIDGGGGVVTYFNHGTQAFNASRVIMMDCDLAGSRALLQNLFNQALAGDDCLAMLASPPAPPSPAGTLALAVNYGPYVARAYQDLLGRAADTAGLSYWSAQLAGGLSRAAFTNALTHSDEYYRRLVATDYQAYLRQVDAASLSYWANQFEHGLTDQQFESILLGSDEFYQRHGGTNTAWVEAIYQALLGRSADSQSESYWNNQLQAGVSRQAIAYQIAAGPEALSRLVERDYQQNLGRAPAAAEVNYWVVQLEHGASNESILASFVASDEFFATT